MQLRTTAALLKDRRCVSEREREQKWQNRRRSFQWAAECSYLGRFLFPLFPINNSLSFPPKITFFRHRRIPQPLSSRKNPISARQLGRPWTDMAEVKQEEMIAHPPMDQLQGFEYCIDSNPNWGEAIALGFEHYILSLGTAVMIPTLLVPLMGGSDGDKVRVVQTLLFVSGINTLIQTLFGTRLPTVLGGSYAFVIPAISIVHDASLSRISDDRERFLQTMRAIQGASIVSSCIQIILGHSQLWGICSRFFSPLGMVPVVSLVGFGLFDRGFPVVFFCCLAFLCYLYYEYWGR